MKSTKIVSDNLFPVVGIGASAGGLDAFRQLLRAIPEKSGMAWVLVQHLAPAHVSALPELLQRVTPIPVLEISDEMTVQPDHIYIIPANKMLVANAGVLQLSPRQDKKGELNLPIDLFFISLAEIHFAYAIGVVLSGTASDGTAGLHAIRDNGGITFAQDEASAAYPGMPDSAVRAGVVDFVLPPEEIPAKIVELTRLINGPADQERPVPEETVFKQILSLLRVRKQTDFTLYKQTTIRRRILRRMAITKNTKPADYLAYLRENKAEQDTLYQDLLIPVTAFFRDTPTFDNLCETVFPGIIAAKPPGDPIRLWVAGCSTGEEAYSIAMCFTESLGDRRERVQIFASDLSEPAIKKARIGLYTKADIASVSLPRLQEFFVRTNAGYQISKPIRDMCVFATHNFLKDPPFGKMDFISCRNVLIYMEPYLQRKALGTFHYALNPGGFLLLGKSETTGSLAGLFRLATKTDKLFSRKDIPGRTMVLPAGQRSEPNPDPTVPITTPELMRTDFQKTADDILLGSYTPAGVVVNESMEIAHFRGSTGRYLEQLTGKPTHNLLLMAKNGLAFELRSILHKARKENRAVTKENIPVDVNGTLTTIGIEAIPLPNTVEPYYLVLFHDARPGSTRQPATHPNRLGTTGEPDEKDARIRQLEQELAQLREDMRGITEDQEVTNEELQSANEELLSGNEELQSLNEELETSREELQSTNEELTVVNQEMVSLNEQLTTSRDYAEAIIANIREPLLVLDNRLRVKTVNQAFYKTFRVSESATVGELVYDLGNRQWNIAELRMLLERILPEKSVFADFEITHTFAGIGRRTMLLNAREIVSVTNAEKLILLSIEDMTDAATARDAERQAARQFRFIADAMPQKVWTADAAGNVTYFNQLWLDYTGLTTEELSGWGWKRIIHPDDWAENQRRWQQSIDTGADFELEHRFLAKDGTWRWHLSRGIAYTDETGERTMWVGTNTDIDAQKRQMSALEQAVADRTRELQTAHDTLEGKNNELREKNRELEAFTYVSSHDLQEPLRKIQTLSSRILDKEHQNLTAGGQDSFRRMQRAAERMQALIQDLLAFSSLGTAERVFETVALSPLVERVTDEFSEIIAERQADIDCTGLGTARVIPFQFRQLMQNLIGNALKFARPDVPPRVVIRSETIRGDATGQARLLPQQTYTHITVSDNGIGFEPQYRDRIFEVFQRLHGREQYAGTGIGLAIVRRIIDNHDGSITATGDPGQGATFDIYLPTE